MDSVTNNVPVTAAARGVKRGHGIDRQYAVYLNTDSHSEDGEGETFNLEAILERLATSYHNINFQKYEEALRQHGITYLDIAAKFPTSWYTNPEKTGMSEGEANLFREWVMKEMVKRVDAQQVRGAKGKKRLRVSSPKDDKDKENNPPVASSSRLD